MSEAPDRRVVHLDADAFFASVEQASDPRLRGRPIAVGGEQRGIIASASYEARRFGIRTPMPTSQARKLCPRLVILPGDYEKYERFSQWMFSYAYDFTPDVEVTSIDEGYLDLTATRKNPVTTARTLRDAIRQSLKITISEGIGTNKLVSQIASKLNKPAAFAEVPAGHETLFLHPLPNRWLPGIGPVASGRLNAAGLARIGQVAATPVELLEMLVGNAAPTLRQFALGRDERPIIPLRPAAKSYGQQETFAQDQTDEPFIEATLRRMADHLMARVRADGKSVRTITVKVRYNDMDEEQCSESLPEPTDLETDIYGRTGALLRRAWRRRVSLRLVSLRLSQVYEGAFRLELALDRASQQTDARRRLARVVDELRHSLGRDAVLRGHDFLLRNPPPAAPTAGITTAARRPVQKPTTPPATPSPRPAITTAIPLLVRSHYSFLNSTLSPEDVVHLAAGHRHPAVGLCDQGNLHGSAAFALAARDAGIRPIFGAELIVEGGPLRLFVENATGFANLCRVLSDKPGSPPRGTEPPRISRHDLEGAAGGLIAVIGPQSAGLAELFPGRCYLGLQQPEDPRRNRGPVMAAAAALPRVALLPTHYATPADRWKFDIVQSIRTLTLLQQSHPGKIPVSPETGLHFHPPPEVQSLFRDMPSALRATHEIAERCSGFQFPFGPPQFPSFQSPDGTSSHDLLRRLVFEGARRRYPGTKFDTVRPQLETELGMIHDVGYEDYFLIVWDLLQECRRRGIEWITRGSAADSLVCYCLEISGVCPIRFDLYFRRFLNKERMALHKLPDIDIDFPHDRKDNVVDLLFARYGPSHCAVVGGFSTFRARSAVGDVAKVLGVAEHQVRRFTEHFPWSFGGPPDEEESGAAGPVVRTGSRHGSQGIEEEARTSPLLRLLRASPECRDLPLDEEPYRTALLMAEFLDRFPRHAKMHPCGVVLSRQPLHELTPLFTANKGYPTTHHDMDGVESIGLVKMDILAQGGLAVMRDVKAMLRRRGIEIDLETCITWPAGEAPPPAPAGEPWADPGVWELIASGGARAVHHIESPAMISLCRMCQVSEIDGLIAIVSVIRPGAANEQKKLRFTRRYQGMEPPEYPHPSLEPCLRSTFGLVVYEEHILQICEAFAGLGGGRADVLRRSLVKQQWDTVKTIGLEFTTSARSRGHGEALIREVWELVTGFNGYAFCKAHSTAYGVEAYQSAWLKLRFPAEFMAAVLTHGKGFYNPRVYVLECHRIGIPMLPPSVLAPGPGFEVTDASGTPTGRAIRVPVGRVKHVGDATLARLLQEHRRTPFTSVRDFYLRVRPAAEEFEALLKVGAFDGFGIPRTAQFWELQHAHRTFGDRRDPAQGWLLPPPGLDRLPEVPLTEPTRLQRLQWEEELLGFTASGHPLELFPDIAWDTYCPVSRLGEHVGEEVVTCGLIIQQRVHHQVTGEAMKFLTLCDWTGMVETELFADTYRHHGLATVRYPVLELAARVEPFENGRGHTLRVLRAGRPRTRSGCPPTN